MNRKDKVKTHGVFVYGQYKPSDWFVDWLASYSRGNYKEDKYALSRKFGAKYNVDDYQIQAITGYDYHVDEKVVVTPEFGLRYNYIKREDYEDGAVQTVHGDHMNVLTAVTGAKLSTEFDFDENQLTRSGKVRPYIYLGAGYDMISDKDNAVVSLTNGSHYTIHGNQLDRFSVETKAGANISFVDMIEVSLEYQGNFRGNYKSHAGIVEFKYRF